MALQKTTGLSENARKIVEWIRPLVYGRKEPVNRVVVYHLNVNDKRQEVASYDIEDTGEKDIIVLANEIDTSAFTDAEGMGGLQRYVVQAFVRGEDGIDKAISRIPFRIRVDSEDGDNEPMESEPATPKGLVSQAQRFAEGAVRMSLGASTAIISTMQKQMARQQDTIEKLTEQRFELFETLEALRSEKSKREIEEKDAELKATLKRDAYDKLAMLAPILVNKLAGQKLLPEKLTPSQQILKQLAESISPQQMDAMRGILHPEQLIALAEMMQATQGDESNNTTALTVTTETKQ